MFNRNNLPSVPNPFSSRQDGAARAPPRDPYASQGQGPAPPRRNEQAYPPRGRGDYDTRMHDGYGASRHSPAPPQYDGTGSQRGMTSRSSGMKGRQGTPGATWQLRPAKSPDNTYTFRNLVAVSPMDIPPSRDGSDILLLLQNAYVVSARPYDGFPPGQISLSDAQRTWMGIALTDIVSVEMYDPFSNGGQAYLGAMDMEIGFASQKKQEQKPYDQDELAKVVTGLFENQVFAPGQRLMMDLRSIPLLLVVKTVQLMDLTEKSSSAPTTSDPTARGIVTAHTAINFYKDAKTPIQLKGSTRRPAANSIVAPDFKFENMGIGGLDTEFSTIFRRAFASRIFPPGLVEKLGIQHVKGILLFGPPGTGKTLIARQIGKMLNAREPKVINGPEVLNKYVGQSEENIRKLFADAEKEYKEKGDESGLHIIIFDELDAVCKQRGSGAGGGTGVGDSVVNQLLSKLDGVDQLNNILLIGMTNRMDMIDDALLRPGRLEVHMEISLPDEHGRSQILKIHTQKMRENNVMDRDVDLAELAHLTKNFSGAEINGLVKSATSFAFNRHVKVGTMAGISDDIDQMKVNRQDFFNALEEVKPAFGVSEAELEKCLHGGIIHYSPFIDNILAEGRLFVEQVRKPDSTPLFSVLLHGPPASGKTALAAKIAIDSEYPFIKLVSPEDMVGFNEMAKVQYLSKVFMDAYKSPMSIIVMDNIERIVDWVPIGPRFSNSVLQTIMVLLSKQPPKGRRLLILATTNERSVLQQLDIFNSFNSDIPVPNVNSYEELAHVMQKSGAFSPQDIQRSLEEIRDITQSQEVGVGIKRILLGIETAKQDADMASRFSGVISRAVAERQYS
ncbi:Vesicular-fusion protein sec18 [Endocarpon pusillum Z07020]|uniref:Vesicular-fusion protein SEC18 n=1 Tax=Endocarpon pusillum (strain Z07020 / HMAS-L-300199) TaxID=1263415 RepID=U1HZP8_ENDPU|nr:Vesicular-fusion protein sec18 [Endocarpon pusillum Z07020]ERF76400.1 Vesicular-fusion protein sec18 [Endocarpon pusillum Z07020]